MHGSVAILSLAHENMLKLFWKSFDGSILTSAGLHHNAVAGATILDRVMRRIRCSRICHQGSY